MLALGGSSMSPLFPSHNGGGSLGEMEVLLKKSPRPRADIQAAPPFTQKELLERINEWSTTTAPTFYNLDDFESPGGEGNGNSKSSLIMELRKIRQSLDPEDWITPRVVVKEFQSYIDRQKGPEHGAYLPKDKKKKVQFSGYSEASSTLKEESDKKKKNTIFSTNLDVRFTVSGSGKGPLQLQEAKKEEKVNVGGREKEGQKKVKSSKSKSPEGKGVESLQGPEWWRRKIRQKFLQTEEMMNKLVAQRKNDEKEMDLPRYTRLELQNPRRLVSYRESSKSYASSMSARAIRMERKRLDSSMERLKRQHEECFGECKVGDLKPPKGGDRKSQNHTQKSSSGSRGMSRIVQKEEPGMGPTRSPIHIPKTLASRFMGRKELPPVPSNYTQHMNHMMDSFAGQGHNKSNTGQSAVVVDGTTTTTRPHPPPNQKPHQEHKSFFSQFREPNVKILYERHPEHPAQTHQNGSPSTTVEASGRNRKEWVERLAEAKIKQKIRVASEERSEKAKEKEETNALYHELLLNKKRLEVDVVDKRDKYEALWRKRGGKAGGGGGGSSQGGKKGHNRRKIQRDSSDDEDPNQRPSVRNKVGLGLKYSWREEPKGLSMWLEGVMAKAKDQKDANQRQKFKDNLILPLSSYK